MLFTLHVKEKNDHFLILRSAFVLPVKLYLVSDLLIFLAVVSVLFKLLFNGFVCIAYLRLMVELRFLACPHLPSFGRYKASKV